MKPPWGGPFIPQKYLLLAAWWVVEIIKKEERFEGNPHEKAPKESRR